MADRSESGEAHCTYRGCIFSSDGPTPLVSEKPRPELLIELPGDATVSRIYLRTTVFTHRCRKSKWTDFCPGRICMDLVLCRELFWFARKTNSTSWHLRKELLMLIPAAHNFPAER